MAKSSQDKVNIQGISALADAFDKAWHNKYDTSQPKGSLTAKQYAELKNLPYFTARRRLEELVQCELATKSKEHFQRSFVYFLKEDE